eukprot:jgi/Bigna1/74661/fgenesh1_pg.30_\
MASTADHKEEYGSKENIPVESDKDHYVRKVLSDISNDEQEAKSCLYDISQKIGWKRNKLWQYQDRMRNAKDKAINQMLENLKEQKRKTLQQIDTYVEEMQVIVAQLHIEVELPKYDKNQTILANLAVFENAFQQLAIQREGRLKAYNDAIRHLNEKYLQHLGGKDVSTCFQSVEDEKSAQHFYVEEERTIQDDLSKEGIVQIQEFEQVAIEQMEKRKAFIAEKCEICREYLQELDLMPDSKWYSKEWAVLNLDVDKAILKNAFTICFEDIQQLYNRTMDLFNLKVNREKKVSKYAEEIQGLWQRLGISEKERAQFMSSLSDLSPITILNCKAELERLKALRDEHVKDQIARHKTAIGELWDEMGIPEDERKQFSPFFSEHFTDETVECLKEKVEELETSAKDMRPILKLVKQREELVREKRDLDAKVKELGGERFRIRGFMIREGKIRERFAKKLPSILKKLKALLSGWEDENKRDLMYKGEKVSSIISQKV